MSPFFFDFQGQKAPEVSVLSSSVQDRHKTLQRNSSGYSEASSASAMACGCCPSKTHRRRGSPSSNYDVYTHDQNVLIPDIVKSVGNGSSCVNLYIFSPETEPQNQTAESFPYADDCADDAIDDVPSGLSYELLTSTEAKKQELSERNKKKDECVPLTDIPSSEGNGNKISVPRIQVQCGGSTSEVL